MINIKRVKEYCSEDLSLVENYDKAVSDNSQVWHCHHRAETDENKPRKELVAEGRYWYVPAKELIFLTKSEHRSLHMKGRKLPEETRKKLSETERGENNPFYGKHHTAEARRKISEARKGSHWYNNGIKTIFTKECPGLEWKRGRLLNV